jgi:2-polyprenyl-3-methyl-5-hydroxy-6-metoxy-1,4-benzoquinol methylase
MIRNREYARQLANKYVSKGEPLSWFEILYESGKSDLSLIPWADLKPNPNLIEFINKNKTVISFGSCVVVGCGLGDDAEYLSTIGFKVDSFDISSTSIEICKERFPKSNVKYFVDDITCLKTKEQYDFVFEAYTLQVLPLDLREKAIRLLPSLIKTNGQLLLISRARAKNENEGNMPWPLTLEELEILKNKLNYISFEDYWDTNEDPKIRRFRALYKNTMLPNKQ